MFHGPYRGSWVTCILFTSLLFKVCPSRKVVFGTKETVRPLEVQPECRVLTSHTTQQHQDSLQKRERGLGLGVGRPAPLSLVSARGTRVEITVEGVTTAVTRIVSEETRLLSVSGTGIARKSLDPPPFASDGPWVPSRSPEGRRTQERSLGQRRNQKNPRV